MRVLPPCGSLTALTSAVWRSAMKVAAAPASLAPRIRASELGVFDMGRFSSAGWLVVGFVCAVLIVPPAAQAAAALTKIVGLNGSTAADVNKANQLTIAETAPASFRQYVVNNETDTAGVCSALGTVPANRGLIVRGLSVEETQTAAVYGDVVFFAGANCTGTRIGVVSIDGTSPNSFLPITPGFAVPAGTVLSALQRGNGAIEGDFILNGYVVPSAAVPTVTGSQ